MKNRRDELQTHVNNARMNIRNFYGKYGCKDITKEDFMDSVIIFDDKNDFICGLRRSELINLKINDIDSNRGLIVIRQSKGKKDRVVPLSQKILTMLREYFLACRPKEWLFEGQDKKSR
jgi:integrase